MPTWKLVLLKAAGYAGGVILALSVVVGSIVWYTSRPVKPKPWNRDSIVASYYRVTESDESTAKLEFEYILDNKTDRDYELRADSSLKIAARLEDTNSLTGFADEYGFVVKLPVFVPAHQKTRITFSMPSYGFSTVNHPSNASTQDERHKYYAEVATHVKNKMANLNGFVLFDEVSRYQIELPNGWKQVVDETNQKVADKGRVPPNTQ